METSSEPIFSLYPTHRSIYSYKKITMYIFIRIAILPRKTIHFFFLTEKVEWQNNSKKNIESAWKKNSGFWCNGGNILFIVGLTTSLIPFFFSFDRAKYRQLLNKILIRVGFFIRPRKCQIQVLEAQAVPPGVFFVKRKQIYTVQF